MRVTNDAVSESHGLVKTVLSERATTFPRYRPALILSQVDGIPMGNMVRAHPASTEDR